MTPALLSLLSGPVLPYRSWQYGAGGYDPAQRYIDCSSLTAAVLHRRYGWGDPDRRTTRTADLWGDLALWRDRLEYLHGRWSPIETVLANVGGIGNAGGVVVAGPHLPGPVQLVAGALHLCQVWRGAEGHAWMWAASEDDPDTGWVVESSGTGPRLWCASGKIPMHEAIDEDGVPLRDWRPMHVGVRLGKWTDWAWASLPAPGGEHG